MITRAQRLPRVKNLTRLFWRKPLVTAKIVIGIHWETLHLFTRKRARYHHPGPLPLRPTVRQIQCFGPILVRSTCRMDDSVPKLLS